MRPCPPTSERKTERHVWVHRVAIDVRTTTGPSKPRCGDDEQVNTSNDESFDTLEELDAVPYVGAEVLDAMLTYAVAHDYVPAGVASCVDNTHLRDCDQGGAIVARLLGCMARTRRPG
jgi:hypothetical protein